MSRRSLCCATILAALLLRCAGTSERPPDSGTAKAPDGQIGYPDQCLLPPDSAMPVADSMSPDQMKVNACTAMTTDGIHLNPGCDSLVQSAGVDALDFTQLMGKPHLLVLAASDHYWWYDLTAGAFVSGGASFTAYLKDKHAPGCGPLTGDGIALNAGCDATVTGTGVRSIATLDNSDMTRQALTSKAKWWSLDRATPPTAGTFVEGGASFSAFAKLFPPGCAAKTIDGLPLNPGCMGWSDGPHAMDIRVTGATYGWLLLFDNLWWRFSSAAGTFTEGGKDFTGYLKQQQPTCGVKTADGIELNPGCDAQVQANGLDAMASGTFQGNEVWLVTSGRRYWIYDYAAGAFVSGGQDIAAFFRTLSP